LEQKVIGANLTLSCAPFETQYISLEHWKELKEHLNGKSWVHQRPFFLILLVFQDYLLETEIDQKGSMSVTHTYYDLTHQKDKNDYWKVPSDVWHPAALMLPLKESSQYTTRVYFYPIYSPSEFWIDLELYNLEGKLIKKIKEAHHISLIPTFSYLDLNSFSKDLDANALYTFKLIAYTKDGSEIPLSN